MNMISLDGVGKSLGHTLLFENVSLGIDAGERIGFVGRNGSGKSTLLRMINGDLEPDAGSISRNRALRLSTVEQRPLFSPQTTIADFLFGPGAPAAGGEPEEAAAVQRRFLAYCTDLGVGDTSLPLGVLSGGMVRKVSLARCLARDANFLTLDEPTNHLDLDAVEWLEAYLKNAPLGFIMVTHDRYFLDAVCTAVLEIDARRIYKYPGNYGSYLERRAERIDSQKRAERKRSSTLRVELEWLKRGPRARTGKDKGRKARLEDLIDSAAAPSSALDKFSSSHRRQGGKILELHGVAKSYGGKPVIRSFSYTFKKGERIGIIGANGSGKTTFLNLVSGALAPDHGTVVTGQTTVFGHFDQTGSRVNGGLSVIEFMKEPGDLVRLTPKTVVMSETTITAEQFLERFLFPRAMQSLTLERLSGGEFRRLCLVRLLATAPNFLVLDEPTNDLDLDTTRLLEEFLLEFTGCLMIVSHDRALLDRLTDYLFVFDGAGGIRGFAGNYSDYHALRLEETKSRAGAATPRPQPRQTPRERNNGLSFKERREYEALLEEISRLEKEKGELEAGFQRAVRDPAEIEVGNRRYRELESELEAKMRRWEELGERAQGGADGG